MSQFACGPTPPVYWSARGVGARGRRGFDTKSLVPPSSDKAAAVLAAGGGLATVHCMDANDSNCHLALSTRLST